MSSRVRADARLKLAMVAMLVIAFASIASAGRSDYVGSQRCGTCHAAELAAWQSGPHARAAASIPAGQSSACSSCHTTGDAPTGPITERAVGCEACHGPGAGYSPGDVMRDLPLAKALGLRDLRTRSEWKKLCSTCHRGVRTQLAPTNLDAEWRRIRHLGASR